MFCMTAHMRVRGLFRSKPPTGDELRAVEEAGLAMDRLRNLKTDSRSPSNPAGQQAGAAVGQSKVRQAADDAVDTRTPQQREREEFGTEL